MMFGWGLHKDFMGFHYGFHGKSWDFHGNSWDFHWNFHGNGIFIGFSWDFYGNSWDFHWIFSWKLDENLSNHGIVMRISWVYMFMLILIYKWHIYRI